ncbi:hypothetical protein [Coleofasciculus sp. G2-EDA-02]
MARLYNGDESPNQCVYYTKVISSPAPRRAMAHLYILPLLLGGHEI